MKKEGQFTSIDAYLDNQPDHVRDALLELRSYILEAAPNSKELINYNIPAFALIDGGKREQQIMIAGYKKHLGFYPHPSTMEHFWDRLSEYKRAKGSVQFPLTKPLPKTIIMEMVRYRKQQVESDKNQG